MELNAISVAHVTDVSRLDSEVQNDEKLAGILTDLLLGQQIHPGFMVKGGHLLFKGSLVLPKTSTYISALMKEFHDSPIGGHSGYLRTYKRVASLFYWEGMRRESGEEGGES